MNAQPIHRPADEHLLVASVLLAPVAFHLESDSVERPYIGYDPVESGCLGKDQQLVGIELEPFEFDAQSFLCFDIAAGGQPISLQRLRLNIAADLAEPREILLGRPQDGLGSGFFHGILLSVVARTNTVASGGGSPQPASPNGKPFLPLARWQAGQGPHGARTPPRVFVFPVASCWSPILPALSACVLRIRTDVGRLLRSAPVFAAIQPGAALAP